VRLLKVVAISHLLGSPVQDVSSLIRKSFVVVVSTLPELDLLDVRTGTTDTTL
jgi:hypothetical protein